MRKMKIRFALLAGLLCFLPVAAPAADAPAAGSGGLEKPVAAHLSEQEIKRLINDPVYRRLKEIEQELEPIPHMARLKHASENPWNLSDDQLQKYRTYATKSRDLAWKKWKHVEEMLRKQKLVTAAFELRVAAQAYRLFEIGKEYEARLEEIHEREGEAYAARYPEDPDRPHSVLGTPDHLEEWHQSEEYWKFKQEEIELHHWRVREGNKIMKELKTGYTPMERLIDNLRNEVLREYQVAVGAERTLDEEIERRRKGGKRRKKKEEEEEERRTKLRLRTNAATEELKQGETAEIWFWVEKGYPPYLIQVYEPKTKYFLDLRFDKAQPFMVPFTFSEAGKYTAQVHARDQDLDTKLEPVKVRFKVTEEKKKPEEKQKPGEEKKPGEKPKSAKKEEQEKPEEKKPERKVRPPLAPGVYRVHLRVPLYLDDPGAGYARKKGSPDAAPDDPIPFDITVDAAGTISGRCEYVFPDEKYDAEKIKSWGKESVYWDTGFSLSGKTDWKTGEVEFSIPDGRVYSYVEDPPHTGGYRIEYTADLKGWRVPGPLEPLLKTYYETLTARFGRAVLFGVWPIVKDSDGTYRMVGDGWFGVGDAGDQGGPPTRPSTVHLVRRTSFRVYIDQRKEEDETEYLRKNTIFSDKYRGKANWTLKIVEKVEEELGGLKGELVGSLGVWLVKPRRVWPPSPIRVRVGDILEFEARGVVSTNYFEPEDLTRKATWKKKGGLKKLAKGKYEAVGTGTAFVRAGVKTGGKWSSSTVKVIILPKREKQK